MLRKVWCQVSVEVSKRCLAPFQHFTIFAGFRWCIIRGMDNDRFEAARLSVLNRVLGSGGIGTLGEKTLHAVVKQYLESDPAKHEQRLGSFVVDVFTGDRIYEIQTRQFRNLRSKLAALVPDYPITIVYPMQARKWLLWIDPDTGELTNPRLSPKRGQLCDVFRELYQIKPFLSHPNLSLLILQIDLEEYRLLTGWSQDRKKGSRRENRLPLSLENELMVESSADYRRLMPDLLPDAFTSADFAKSARVSPTVARTTLNILLELGHVSVCGKQGRLRLYCVSVA